jgi:hypothetical protein
MAMVPLGNMKLSDAWKVAIVFLLAILIGFGLCYKYPCEWLLYRPMMALADGLMVAGIIGLALEFFATRYLYRENGRLLSG